MRKKALFIQILILIITTILMLGSVTYAWFSKFEKTSIIEIDTASLKVDANLYYANTSADNEYEKVEESLVINKVIPGDTFYFLFQITNNGTIDGELSIKTSSILSNNIDIFKFIINDTLYDISDTSNVLFEGIDISPGGTELLYFQIYVTGELTQTEYSNLYIESFNIRIDQKR